MKLYINRIPNHSPWGGGAKFNNAMYEFIPKISNDVQVLNPQDSRGVPDVILAVGLTNDGTAISIDQAIMYKMMRPDVKIVLRVNENDARKNTSTMDSNLIEVSKHINATVFVSDWIRDYFLNKGWHCKNHTVIKNGVDKSVFKPNQKLSLENNKINIVTHHWSDNYMKGFDIYDHIDEFIGVNKGYSFTYIGRDRGTFKNTQVIRPLAAKSLGEELGKYDVYVSASRFDPGPNHISESIACGLPTYVHIDGGGCVEFSGETHVYCDWSELEKILLTGEFSPNQTLFDDWEACVSSYVSYIKSL